MGLLVLVAGIGLVVLGLLASKLEKSDEEKDTYGGMNKAAMSVDDEDFVSLFSNTKRAREFFDATGCYEKGFVDDDEPKRYYPQKRCVDQTSTGVEILFDLPLGMPFEEFEKAIAKGGGQLVFGKAELRCERVGFGQAKLTLISRPPFSGRLTGDFLE
ncbi:hypothetical protein [Corynebacterium oculi]|uniref:Uncharacterized protein n=1 Tax=Corynebacterium oculi TaxID=1544416 RepID=A0A0Q0U0G8_9CORY|nr:hypothetical protein [Corynebacterium oculi]KQB85132.1 hypothetical protein Cocul_00267 [Corynebacterium oculi]